MSPPPANAICPPIAALRPPAFRTPQANPCSRDGRPPMD